MTPKKKLLIIVSALTVVLLIALGVVFFVLRLNSPQPTSENPISNPISTSAVTNEEPAEDNIVAIRRPSIDSTHPFTEDVFTFNIGKGEYQTKEINPAGKFIEGDGFTLYFGAIAESSGGIFESLPESKDIPNKINQIITRVRATENNSNLLELFKNQNEEFQFNYFYSSSIQQGCTIDPNQYCGSDILGLGVKQNGDHLYGGIYCLTNNQANVVKCDNVISNITFELKTEKGYQISDFNNATLSVLLPDNYSLKVLTDVSGMALKVDNVNYEGITGIKIYNENNKEVINIGGVSGVGVKSNIASCPDANSKYEFNLFGNLFKLTEDNKLTRTFTEITTGKFCQPIFYEFKDIYFASGTNAKNTINESFYQIQIDQTLPTKVLYNILSSLVIKNQ